ncbi:MAG TPA: hypothetical protein VES59_04725 [Bacteroidota bacterium]|nr:hypothetical protein [Bacteroidota bacterium]
MYKIIARWLAGIVAILAVMSTGMDCKGKYLVPTNIPPITRLSNVPPPDSFIIAKNPLLTLYWVGDDPDGYVVAFRYRWNFRLNAASPFQYKPWSRVLNIIVSKFALMTDADESNITNVYKYFATLPPEGLSPDSANRLDSAKTLIIAGSHVWASNPKIIHFPVHVNPNSGTFIFDSQDSLNPHTFEVSAIDNAGAAGPPATVSFGTPRVSPPHTQITSSPTDTQLVIDRKSSTFQGIEFDFQGFDPNSRTVDYQWVVDRDLWPPDSIPWSPFTPATFARATAANFRDPYAVTHRFYVRARNEFGSIDTIGADTSFYTLYPPFLRPGYQHRILLLNNSYDWGAGGTAAHPSRAMLDAYYRALFDSAGQNGKYDLFDVVDVNNGPHIFPGLGALGQYSVIVFIGDVTGDITDPEWHHSFLGTRENMVHSYLNVGGKLIITAWNFPFPLNAGPEYTRQIGHLEVFRPDQVKGNFIGARGDKGYPDAVVDTAKLDTASWGQGLMSLWPGRPYGFGEIIYRYDARNNSFFENLAIGVRYLGTTFNVVYLGFPLYYIQQPVPTAIVRKALDDIGELNR